MDEQVSFDDELLILVDKNNTEIGNLSKRECHLGRGRLHRAFSVFILDSDGKVLLQKRSSTKTLWPNYWSNSCCSHPRMGESLHDAAERRVNQELGIHVDLEEIYEFEYHAQYLDVGSEHELCTVYVGSTNAEVRANSNEIADWRWFSLEEIEALLKKEDVSFTPWLKMEWEALSSTHWNKIGR